MRNESLDFHLLENALQDTIMIVDFRQDRNLWQKLDRNYGYHSSQIKNSSLIKYFNRFVIRSIFQREICNSMVMNSLMKRRPKDGSRKIRGERTLAFLEHVTLCKLLQTIANHCKPLQATASHCKSLQAMVRRIVILAEQYQTVLSLSLFPFFLFFFLSLYMTMRDCPHGIYPRYYNGFELRAHIEISEYAAMYR